MDVVLQERKNQAISNAFRRLAMIVMPAAGTALVLDPRDGAAVATADTLTEITALVVKKREARMTVALETAADEAGSQGLPMSPLEILERASNPYVEQILGNSLAGAADAEYRARVVALGKTLGRALSTEDATMQRNLLAESLILRHLQQVHASALYVIASEEPPVMQVGENSYWRYPTLERRLTLGRLATPVVSRLIGEGLIFDHPQQGETPHHWTETKLGEMVCADLIAGGLADDEALSGDR